MDLRQGVLLALRVSIFCTVLGFGLNATTSDLFYWIRRPGLLARSLVSVFLVMPLFALLLVQIFEFRPVVEIALVALAISPIPPLLPQNELRAGGDRSYAVGLMVILSLLAIGVVPLWIEIFEQLFKRPLAIEPAAVARVVFMTTLLPLLAGMALRAAAPAIARSLERPVGLVTKILLPLAVLVLLAAVAPAVWSIIGDGTIAAVVCFVAVGFLVGHLMGSPDPRHQSVLALATACRHPAVALSIALASAPDQRFGAVIVLSLVLGLIVGIPYLSRQRRRTAVLRSDEDALARSSRPAQAVK